MARRLPSPDADLQPLAADMAALGLLVRNRRAHSQLRIDDAAAQVGVSTDVLSRLENGRAVSLDKVFKVLDGFGLTLLVMTKDEAANALETRPSRPGGSEGG
ncbi:helix-turn-helix domain-containing protein [Paraburkholderia sp.]|uniref:helix-turn-helix domain-containing protein n=1 Tax=Paraburkholderia sp. TaxID=1926495 RepID=UPI00239DD866|nr:helix-turn-helix domain-containing protein [Paraburkholderia sp.]MDE1179267.1 helix-turn-helix domain-containing protein [Paraburkholderia sp.]